VPPDVLLGLLLKLVARLVPLVAVGLPASFGRGRSSPLRISHRRFRGFDLATALAERLGRPVRVAGGVAMWLGARRCSRYIRALTTVGRVSARTA
jgi:predicted NBD/HSP70 family sugar kinase